MTSFFRYLTTHTFPKKEIFRTFLKRPLSWHGVALYLLLIAILAVIYIGILTVNKQFLVTIPARGGTVVEGVIGAPRLINPILATTETDIGLTKLLFSGLTKETLEGAIEPDLAATITPSADARTYTFTLREHLKWSDGKPVTGNDIVFTYNKRALFEPNSYWQQVTVTSPDPQTVVFTLPTADDDFLSRTTLGIIPMHIWSTVTDEAFESVDANLHPVGTGPFSFVRLREQNGIVREIILKRNRRYAGVKSYITDYRIVFYANQRDLGQALIDGDITLTTAASPETAHLFEDKYTIDKISSSTIVGLFELTNATLFSPQTLSVLNQSIDKQGILATIEYGYGILPDTARLSLEESRTALQSLGFTTSADGTLEKNGIPIEFSVAVENDPTVLLAAQAYKQALAEIGITIVIKAFDPGTFQDVIQNTEYQFFFGRVKEVDIPPAYKPIMVLYRMSYPFIHHPKLRLPTTAVLKSPLDRYHQSNAWHIRTNNVWNIFNK